MNEKFTTQDLINLRNFTKSIIKTYIYEQKRNWINTDNEYHIKRILNFDNEILEYLRLREKLMNMNIIDVKIKHYNFLKFEQTNFDWINRNIEYHIKFRKLIM